MAITKKARIDNQDLAAEIIKLQDELDSLSPTELGYIDGVTAGTVTASKAVVVDANKDVGGFRNVTATGAVTSGVFAGGVQELSGPGAVDVTSTVTLLTTTGADALTLADGAEGQIKVIKMVTDGGDGTLTPDNLAGGSTITFGDAGDAVVLVFAGGKWHLVANNGAVLAQ